MPMLSDDDLNLAGMTEEELDLAWDLWFDLAQTTNDNDPPYTHGVFASCGIPDAAPLVTDTEPRNADISHHRRP